MIRLAAALLFLALPAAAQAPPACTRAREGQVACMAGKLCECRFERGGQLTGRPDRFAWDCGVMRPMCPPDPNINQQMPQVPPVGGVWLPPSHNQGPPGPWPEPGPGPGAGSGPGPSPGPGPAR